MRELLEKWAALDAREDNGDNWTQGRHVSRFGDHGVAIEWKGGTLAVIPEDYPLNALDQAKLLAATIEAITYRDWDWSVGNSLQRPYRAQVDTKTRTTVERADTPAEALLTAYLAALEAEGQE